jgi:hypothetical protein
MTVITIPRKTFPTVEEAKTFMVDWTFEVAEAMWGRWPHHVEFSDRKVVGVMGKYLKRPDAIRYYTCFIESNLNNPDFFIDTIIHEVIHMGVPPERVGKSWHWHTDAFWSMMRAWGIFTKHPTTQASSYKAEYQRKRAERKPRWIAVCHECPPGTHTRPRVRYGKDKPKRNYRCLKSDTRMEWRPIVNGVIQ